MPPVGNHGYYLQGMTWAKHCKTLVNQFIYFSNNDRGNWGTGEVATTTELGWHQWWVLKHTLKLGLCHTRKLGPQVLLGTQDPPTRYLAEGCVKPPGFLLSLWHPHSPLSPAESLESLTAGEDCLPGSLDSSVNRNWWGRTRNSGRALLGLLLHKEVNTRSRCPCSLLP